MAQEAVGSSPIIRPIMIMLKHPYHKGVFVCYYKRMNLDELQTAFTLFDDARLVSAHNITIGLANDSYLVATDKGKAYVLRALRSQTVDNARSEAKIQELLRNDGLMMPQYMRLKNNDVVGSTAHCRFTISELIAGHRAKSLTLPLIYSFGATLATIHTALADKADVISPNTAQWLSQTNALAEAVRCPQPLSSLVAKRLIASEMLFDKDLPKAVIHGDLFLDNTFAQDGEITAVFDFETAEYTFRLLDIVRSYLAFAYKSPFDNDLIKTALIDGYNSKALLQLTDLEISNFPLALQYVGAACAAWLQNNNGEQYVQPYLSVTS